MLYDVAVIGGGPAGVMAAIEAAKNLKSVLLVERNDSIGKKILITGKGRCNITNMSPIDEFIKRFGIDGKFLRTAFTRFFNEDLIEFFRTMGLNLKVERQNRVFPEDDDAKSVVKALTKCLSDSGVEIRYNARITGATFVDDHFHLTADNGPEITARKIIIATGGASYKITGSSGDGFKMALGFGHKITPLTPGLVPLKTKEAWVKEVQGLTLKNIALTFRAEKKKICSGVGEMLFTHFGVSGPLILDMSADIMTLLAKYGEVMMQIDLKPGLNYAELEKRILSDIKLYGSKDFKNFLKQFMPVALCPVFARIAGIESGKRASQITSSERRSMRDIMKAMPLTITGALPLEEAMVTLGGVAMNEIDPRTMQSRLVPGLYFAGEIIEGAASSGGYNLQQAFSTGYLAGQEASRGR